MPPTKAPIPPRWVDRFLEWFLPDHLLEDVQGDLHEVFYRQVEEVGEQKARRAYFFAAMHYIRPYFFKRRRSHSYTNQLLSTDMLRNYLTIALRNLLRHKAFSFLNTAGLAIGMACSILILLWVNHELSYDRFHAHADKIYRITAEISDLKAAVSAPPVAAALQAGMPEVKNTVRLVKSKNLFQAGDHRFEENGVFYVDSTFLEVFSFPLISGNPKTALSHPDGVLITEATAIKYFGTTDVIGKMLRMDNEHTFTISGLLANVPAHSHLQFDFLLPMAFLARFRNDLKNSEWDSFSFYTYIQFADHVDASPATLQRLTQRINEIYRQNELKLKAVHYLQPLTSIHLHSNLIADVEGHGNIQYVRIFYVVAIFILIVACINFMNLATARSARRAKEVGLRKVVGAKREHLIGQFLGESLLIATLALFLAVLLVWLLLPTFNDLSGKFLILDFSDGKLLLSLLGIVLLTGLLSGSYPALFLSAFQPVQVLKGTLRIGGGSKWFRNGLVVIQFVVSIALMIGTAVVYNQLQFIKHQNLGFDKSNLLYVPMRGALWSKYQAFRAELGNNPLTEDFAVVSDLPTNLDSGTTNVEWEGKDPQFQPIFPHMSVDENFINVFGMQMVSGRSFSKDFKADTANYIVNEKALQIMGMDAATAVGKPLIFGRIKGTIIGVVKDFNFQPIQKTIEPLILRFNTWGGIVVIRSKPGQTEATIQTLEKIYTQLNPEYPFTYNFIDKDLANLYQAEQHMGVLFNVFAGLAIFISCLGLYGLSAFVAERRTKEIGVRKVLGASIPQLVQLLSNDFLKLVLLAFVIATPLAGYAMHQWLEGFAYHINMSWWMFALAGVTALLIALFTISYQSIKAALANPVKSLRNE